MLPDLVSRSSLVLIFTKMNPASDVGRLLLQGNEQIQRFMIETWAGIKTYQNGVEWRRVLKRT